MIKVVLAAAIGALAAASGEAALRYAFTDLGVLPGYEYSYGVDINNNGQVIGSLANYTDRVFTPFIWTMSDGMKVLSGAPADYSLSVRGINDSGKVVGSAWQSSVVHPFTWTAAGGVSTVAPLIGEGSAINNSDQIAGTLYGFSGSSTVRFPPRAYRLGSGFTNIGDLPGGFENGVATAINDLGQVAGYGRTESAYHAFLWTQGSGFQDLGFLAGGYDYSSASGVNASGQVVGEAASKEGGRRPFLWTASGGMRDLGTLPDGFYGDARAINESGFVAGSSVDGTGNDRAVLWRPGAAAPVDLNLLADTGRWVLTAASAINDLGQIVGYMGYDGDDEIEHAFLLTPISGVPEPATWALLIGGFGLIGGSLRARNRKDLVFA